MKKTIVVEDTLPSRLFVAFSAKIANEINIINDYNQNNSDGLFQWRDYLEGMKSYISNKSIAFDYANRYTQLPNGTRYIGDFDYNIGYAILTNRYTNQLFVYIFMANLKPEEFGLEVPPTLRESRQHNYKTKKVYRLNESQLHFIIKEVIKEFLPSA